VGKLGHKAHFAGSDFETQTLCVHKHTKDELMPRFGDHAARAGWALVTFQVVIKKSAVRQELSRKRKRCFARPIVPLVLDQSLTSVMSF